MVQEHLDVLIIGAGLSGIGSAYYLQTDCPDKSYAIVEARSCIGGTWDLFKYPGIRSDSDMYTLGYTFKPWKEQKAIADGPAILNYIRETAAENDIEKHIRFNHRVVRSSWSSEKALWTVEIEEGAAKNRLVITCDFLFACSGYYDYDAGYTPDFKGVNDFKGTIVHPQKWTEDIEYKDKRVIVIGSGATAVTLVPELAKSAKHVIMLQRSPTYIVSRPSEDKVAKWLHRLLPSKMAYALARWKNVLISIYLYTMSRKSPQQVKKYFMSMIQKSLGADYPVKTHFNPRYNPWDERICLVPDGDLFQSIKEGSSEVVTDHIERFTQGGILLQSGKELAADLVVTATGLKIKVIGGMEMVVDGKVIKTSELTTYKGVMFSDVPNFAGVVGYTNNSWTLKCDLVNQYLCRLLNYMDKNDFKRCTPRLHEDAMESKPAINFTSGYIRRAADVIPKQGAKFPWKLHQNYIKDIFLLKYRSLKDDALEFK